MIGSNLRAWAMRILANTFISTRRRQTVERRVLEQAAHDPNGWANTGPSCIKLGLTRTVLREASTGCHRALVQHSASWTSKSRAIARQQKSSMCRWGPSRSRLHRGRTRLAAALSQGNAMAVDSEGIQPASSAA